eukprot:TRINITY_DN2791_c0_g1_i2.p2 TRINITY_DN2791_c0_g1~~TRINITY_DN2791_c0_g1_i2.p2  ORF type:complete len:122 (+),score=16.76 TRINITY_DN2791_c0_g1_i2:234-599(+)
MGGAGWNSGGASYSKVHSVSDEGLTCGPLICEWCRKPLEPRTGGADKAEVVASFHAACFKLWMEEGEAWDKGEDPTFNAVVRALKAQKDVLQEWLAGCVASAVGPKSKFKALRRLIKVKQC